MPVGIFAAHLERRALDAGDLARCVLEDLGAITLAIAVLEVHALEHRRPVLRFRAARARLDVDEAVVRIERIGIHPPEFERGDVLRQLFHVARYAGDGGIVTFGARKLKELLRIRKPAVDAAKRADQRFELLLFLAELLRALRLLPQLRIFELAVERR